MLIDLEAAKAALERTRPMAHLSGLLKSFIADIAKDRFRLLQQPRAL